MKHFSSYLLDHNLITQNELEDCIAAAAASHPVISRYAVNKGRTAEGLPKAIAIENLQAGKINFTGLCDPDDCTSQNQVFESVKYQAFNHNYLGVSLVNLGYMTVNSLKTHLGRYKKQVLETDDLKEIEDSQQFATKLFRDEVINCHRNFLFNLGYSTELVSVSRDYCPDDDKINFATSLTLNRKTTCYVGISVEKDTMLNIAALKAREYMTTPSVGELYEVFGQILFNLNYSVCRNLKNKGMKLKHGAVQYSFPCWRECIATRCRLLNEYIDISIMR